MAHWLEHWTHDHKVVGASPDSSSYCWVSGQDSEPTLFLPTQVKKKWVPARYHAAKVKQIRLCRRSSIPHNRTLWAVRLRVLSFGFNFYHWCSGIDVVQCPQIMYYCWNDADIWMVCIKKVKFSNSNKFQVKNFDSNWKASEFLNVLFKVICVHLWKISREFKFWLTFNLTFFKLS